jgi:hypothetical protein
MNARDFTRIHYCKNWCVASLSFTTILLIPICYFSLVGSNYLTLMSLRSKPFDSFSLGLSCSVRLYTIEYQARALKNFSYYGISILSCLSFLPLYIL